MTFDELRNVLGGGPVTSGQGMAERACKVPSLPAHLLDSIDGIQVVDTDFPGCFHFWVPVDEGEARYIGVVTIGSSQRKHSVPQ
jgi:hypothetical protein